MSEENKERQKPFHEHFMDMLTKQTEESHQPKLATEKERMNIINSWLMKKTDQVKKYLNPKGKPNRTQINYLGHMFAKAGISKNDAYQYVKEKYFKPGMDEDAFAKEFDDEYDTTASNSEWIQRVFKKQ